MESTIQASRMPKRRAPRTFGTGRVCADQSCDTIVSRYNKSDRCNLHRPTHYPRIRGAFVTEAS
jgi:hypothetical protein